jgi:Bacteriocin-protection, YdeI or OmpD-Associated/Domain of unknown function (DUF1905)
MATKRPADPPEVPAASFDGVLAAHGNNTGIVVPPEVIEQLDAGRRPPLSVDLNGHVFRSTVGVMSGQYLIGVSAAIRKATGLGAGDAIHVKLTVDSSPRSVEIPEDLAAALAAAPEAAAFFGRLSNSLQRYHVDQVSSAKTAETRERRIAKAIDTFLAGKQR